MKKILFFSLGLALLLCVSFIIVSVGESQSSLNSTSSLEDKVELLEQDVVILSDSLNDCLDMISLINAKLHYLEGKFNGINGQEGNKLTHE